MAVGFFIACSWLSSYCCFDSTAVVLIDKSKLVVKPLTRLTLDKLLERSSGSVAASLFLRVGSVQASVKATTPRESPRISRFRVPIRPLPYAAPNLEFDGFHLKVIEGVVRLIPGRPARDTEGSAGGDAEFEGALPVDPANPNAAVNVAQDQQASVDIHQSLGPGAWRRRWFCPVLRQLVLFRSLTSPAPGLRPPAAPACARWGGARGCRRVARRRSATRPHS